MIRRGNPLSAKAVRPSQKSWRLLIHPHNTHSEYLRLMGYGCRLKKKMQFYRADNQCSLKKIILPCYFFVIFASNVYIALQTKKQ